MSSFHIKLKFLSRFHFEVNRCHCPLEEVAKRALLDGLEESQVRVFFLPLQINEIPKLAYGCTDFIMFTEQILEERKMNQALLGNIIIVLCLTCLKFLNSWTRMYLKKL